MSERDYELAIRLLVLKHGSVGFRDLCEKMRREYGGTAAAWFEENYAPITTPKYAHTVGTDGVVRSVEVRS